MTELCHSIRCHLFLLALEDVELKFSARTVRHLVPVDLVLILFELLLIQLLHRSPTGVRQYADEPCVDLLRAAHSILILALA